MDAWVQDRRLDGAAPSGPDNDGTSMVFGDSGPSPVPEKAGECACIGNQPDQTNAFEDGKQLTPMPGKMQNGIPGYNICTDSTAVYAVRVHLAPGASWTCDGYIINFEN